MALPDAELPVFSFAADFSSDVIETIEYLTDIITAETGSEQRRSMRIGPRRFFEFDLAEWGSARTYLDLAIRQAGGEDWHLPVPTDFSSLVVNSPEGVQYLAVADIAPEYVVGGYAFVCGPDARYGEKVKITGTNGGGAAIQGGLYSALFVDTPLENPWPAGSRVYPLVRAEMTEQPTLSRKSSRAMTSSVKFRLIGSNDYPALDPNTFDQYRGAPVFRQHPNLLNDSDYTYSRQLVEFDGDTGLVGRVDTGSQGFTGQQFEFLAYGRKEHADLKALLYYFRGRQKSFWMPSFMDDLYISAPATAESYELHVEYAGLSYFGVNVGREDICVEFNNGVDPIYARIVSAKQQGDNEILTLDTAFLADVPIRDVRRISFMEKCRQDQDSTEITHKSDLTGACTVSTVFRSYSDTRVDYVAPQYTPLQQFTISRGPGAELTLPRIPSPGDSILTIYTSFSTGDGALDYHSPGGAGAVNSTDFAHTGVYVQTFENLAGGNGVIQNTRRVSGGVAFEFPALPDQYTGKNGGAGGPYPMSGFAADYNDGQEYTLVSQPTTAQKSVIIAFSSVQVNDITSGRVSSGANAYITGDGDLQAQQPSYNPNPGISCRALYVEGVGKTATFKTTFNPGSGGDDPSCFSKVFFVMTVPLTED